MPILEEHKARRGLNFANIGMEDNDESANETGSCKVLKGNIDKGMSVDKNFYLNFTCNPVYNCFYVQQTRVILWCLLLHFLSFFIWRLLSHDTHVLSSKQDKDGRKIRTCTPATENYLHL